MGLKLRTHLNERNLATLESVKSTYIKRAIGVSKNTKSSLVYLLTRETFLIEDLRTMYPLSNTTGVAKNTRSRLVYLLARKTFLIEDLRTMYPLPNTTASENLLKSLIKRREEVPIIPRTIRHMQMYTM